MNTDPIRSIQSLHYNHPRGEFQYKHRRYNTLLRINNLAPKTVHIALRAPSPKWEVMFAAARLGAGLVPAFFSGSDCDGGPVDLKRCSDE